MQRKRWLTVTMAFLACDGGSSNTKDDANDSLGQPGGGASSSPSREQDSDTSETEGGTSDMPDAPETKPCRDLGFALRDFDLSIGERYDDYDYDGYDYDDGYNPCGDDYYSQSFDCPSGWFLSVGHGNDDDVADLLVGIPGSETLRIAYGNDLLLYDNTRQDAQQTAHAVMGLSWMPADNARPDEILTLEHELGGDGSTFIVDPSGGEEDSTYTGARLYRRRLETIERVAFAPWDHMPTHTLRVDSDGDGQPDVVVATRDLGLQRFWIDDGELNTQTMYRWPLELYQLRGLTLGEFSGDSRIDLAYVANTGAAIELHVATQESNGTLQGVGNPTPLTGYVGAMVMGNLDGKGLGEIAMAYETSDGPASLTLLHREDDHWRFEAVEPLSIYDLALADLHGDGTPEVLVLTAQTLWAFDATDGSFTELWSTAPGSAIASTEDLNADGHPDLVLTNHDPGSGSILVGTCKDDA